MIWTDLAFGLHYMGLNLGKNEFGLQFFLVGPRFRLRIGPKSGWPKRGPAGRVWAPGKKIRLINRPTPGRGSGSGKKKPAQIRPVAIPISKLEETYNTIILG